MTTIYSYSWVYKQTKLRSPTLYHYESNQTKLRIVKVLSQVAQDGAANEKPPQRVADRSDRQPVGGWKVIRTWGANF